MILKNQEELDSQIKLQYFQFKGKDKGLACKCCNTLYIDPEAANFFLILEKFQNFLNYATVIKRPEIKLTNCYRCEKHNKEVGGEPHSAHMSSIAADIYSEQISALDLLKNAAAFSKFKGIGYYPDQGFLHVDIKDRSAPTYWIKRQNKPYKYFTNFMELMKSIRSE